MSRRGFRAFFPLIPVVLALALPSGARAEEITAAGGTTERTADAVDETHRTEVAPFAAAPTAAAPWAPSHFTTDPAWDLVQQSSVWRRIKIGERVAVQFDHVAQSLVTLAPADPLTTLAREAVNRAPTWLQKPLEDLFSRLSTAAQDKYANPILAASDPYVDEIAFEVAHLAPEDLNNAAFNVQLLTDNATWLYAIDAELAYADIVDYGSAATGGDYYSTVRYKVDEGGTINTYELPREIYYWYIVHPRGSDEVPTYINPSATCSSAGTPAAPPTGKFWRQWLYYGGTNKASGQCDNNQDGTLDGPCPVLRTQLSGVQVLWGGGQTGAVGVVSDWVRRSMGQFGDRDSCRPIEPVTIYYNMDGACGEWGDLTMGAARSALIPAIVIDDAPNDHCWNEFYERGWHQWEPVNGMVDAWTAYDSWWASHGGMASTHAWRGDGYGWTSETAQYTPYATLTVTVYDANHYPVDGAKVELYSEYDPVPIVLQRVSQGATNDHGQITFTIGDGRNFNVKVTSPWGTVYPTSGTARVVTGSVAGNAYSWSPPNFAGVVPRLSVTADTPPSSPTDDFLLEVGYGIGEEYLHGAGYGTSITYTQAIQPGNTDFFVADRADWNLFESGSAFQGFRLSLDSPGQDVSFVVPTADDYYVTWSNKAGMNLAQVVDATVRLYHNNGSVPPVTALRVDRDASMGSLLDWEDVAGQNVDGYNVYRSTSASDVAGARSQTELAPFLLQFVSASAATDAATVAPGSCFFYSVRTHSSKGGISP